MIEVKEQTFEIKGEKKFIFGGELHYFRVPRELWRDRIIKVREAGCNLISTYIPWVWHEKEEGNIDLTGTTTPERDLASFLEMVKEEGMYCLVRPGPYIMSEIRNHGIPFWINENYPEVVARKQNGQKHPTDVVSYLHPKFIEKVSLWYKAVCEIIRCNQIASGGPVVMCQLDNEIGMLQWVTNQADYNEDTITRFIKYIRNKYTIQKANEILNVDIRDYEELKVKIKYPNKKYGTKLQNEFMLFMREYYLEYVATLKKLAIGFGIEVPFVVNVHGFDSTDYAKRGKRYPIGLSQLYSAIKSPDIVTAGDYYIGNIVHDNFHDVVLANAFTKAIQNENQPLFSAEFQSGFQNDIPRLQPTTYDLTTRLCIANGMNALNYYMFVGGENYEDLGFMGRRHNWQAPVETDGSFNKHYYTIKHLGSIIKAVETELLETKRDIVTYLGFYPDYFMTEYNNKQTSEMYERIKVFREAFLFNGIGKGLVLNNITFEGLDLKAKGKIDVNKIKSLWVMSCHWMDEDLQEKLLLYVKEGGRLVLFPAVPTMDMKGNPCTLLIDALKIKIKRSGWYEFIECDGIDEIGAGYIETYEGEELSPLARSEKYTDEVCGFEKNIDNGKIIVFGAGVELEHHFKDEIILKLASRIENYPATKRNDYIDVSFRSVPDSNTRFIFIHNYDEYDKAMVFDYFGETLFDGKELIVPARSGLMLPFNLRISESLMLEYSTCELISRSQNELEVYCRQNNEHLKFEGISSIMPLEADYEIIDEGATKELLLKNCYNKKITIKL